jgi:hypothetical protein
MIRFASALVIAVAIAGCARVPSPSVVAPAPTATLAPTSLVMDATGLGPCTQQWYTACNYGIRVEGPGGYDHRGGFAWDEGPRPGLDHGPAGPVASTGTYGDVPTTLGPGSWTISFRLWYGSDAISLEPVPGGTPRNAEEDPFIAACSTVVDAAVVVSVTLHVAFDGGGCTVATERVGR